MQSTTEDEPESKKKNYQIRTVSIPKYLDLYCEKKSTNRSKLIQKAILAQLTEEGIDIMDLKKEAIKEYGLEIEDKDIENW